MVANWRMSLLFSRCYVSNSPLEHVEISSGFPSPLFFSLPVLTIPGGAVMPDFEHKSLSCSNNKPKEFYNVN
jgi:hypothetical protein